MTFENRPSQCLAMAAIVAVMAATACGGAAVEPRSQEAMDPLVVDGEPYGDSVGEHAGASGGNGLRQSYAGSPDGTEALMAATYELIERCVDHVQVGAFLGDAALAAWWEGVDHDVDDLRESCRDIALEDPWRLGEMSEAWAQTQSALAAAPADGVSGP